MTFLKSRELFPQFFLKNLAFFRQLLFQTASHLMNCPRKKILQGVAKSLFEIQLGNPHRVIRMG